MHFSNILPLLSLAALAVSHPTIHENHLANLGSRDDLPRGAFITPTIDKPTPSSTPSPGASKLGHAIVQNHCAFRVYLWSVGSTVLPVRALAPNDNYSEVFRENPDAGGIAIKISVDRDGLYNSSPQMVFAYNLSSTRDGGKSQERVWYDLSDVFGDPFVGYPVSLTPSEPLISWEDGVPPAGSQVRVAASSTDLVLSLC
ncbi:hypothetical protein N7475_005166 [Penicillium sp. IBT 31633x]|nr:hypothetical protein N7475_005166 [Penicillium sp. IBT 31633x]